MLRPITIVDHEIANLERKLRKLKAERHSLLKLRRLDFDNYMDELFEIIAANPGITKVEICKKIKPATRRIYGNKMTALVRRGAIVNTGTKRMPTWYVAGKECNASDCVG